MQKFSSFSRLSIFIYSPALWGALDAKVNVQEMHTK